MDRQKVKEYLSKFEFVELFNHIGWDKPHGSTQEFDLQEDGRFAVRSVGQKRNFPVFVCANSSGCKFPDSYIRRKLERLLAKTHIEHLLIFEAADKSRQTWQWVKRKDKKRVPREIHFYADTQSGELLLQKLSNIEVPFEEEEDTHLHDVLQSVESAFDVEPVTKKFYEEFKKRHDKFLKFIDGIPDEKDKSWYASVMLNRLMFIYFVQAKGFLNKDENYLKTNFDKFKDKKDKYYSDFLCPLFFSGFAQPVEKRDVATKALLGSVPYLSGGIFDKTDLEIKDGHKISIPDAVFKELFTYFGEWRWYLDERPIANDKEINPDVLGYIFEKYINQKQMGAYYTKEDITGYISRNTIIPFIFNAVEKASGPLNFVWEMLKADPEAYFYKSVLHGVKKDLPADIAAGEADVSKRGKWNTHAPEEYGLPTEIWREHIDRRNRYKEALKKITSGGIRSINDFITYNLNIEAFALDVIENCESSAVLESFWETIKNISVLDPTCGSGAFLFAAINILESMYEACISKMGEFLETEKTGARAYKFKQIIDEIRIHPSQKYFIYKSIVLRNIYGVDIMPEAVEIARLRLYLKLMAQVEDASQIEPLPDIDFNLKAGNTLVGFANKAEVKKAVETEGCDQGKLVFEDPMPEIEAQCENVDKLFELMREAQCKVQGRIEKKDKDELKRRLKVLDDKLNLYLASEYGISENSIPNKAKREKAYKEWLESHIPFHWFVEFYGVMKKGGFDVIIGNPPYVNIAKVDYSFKKLGFLCESCNDLFALVVERVLSLNLKSGRSGLIIPLSATSTKTMQPLRENICGNCSTLWASYYSASDQPASLFTGVRHRLLILLAQKGAGLQTQYPTRFLKWFSEERSNLFPAILSYRSEISNPKQFCKVSSKTESDILEKMQKFKHIENYLRKHGTPIYYHNAPVHWGKVFDFVPYFKVGKAHPEQSSHVKTLYFEKPEYSTFAICLFNSSLFYWYNWQFSNCRDLTLADIQRTPAGFDMAQKNVFHDLECLKDLLMKDLKHNKKIYKRISGGVETQFDSFYPMVSKKIIDKIDYVLGQHYRLTPGEVDFIINYDLKYRMGLRDENADED